MTKTFFCYCFPALFCALLPRFVSADNSRPTTDTELEVTRFVFTRQVVDRQPQGEVQNVPLDGHRVYGFIEVLNRGAPRQLTMVWRQEGKQVARFSLDVGSSPRWRTWSYLRARKSMLGQWEVSVKDDQGNLLASESLIIGSDEGC
jgi:hypothetical protein